MENSIIKNCKRCNKEFETSKFTPYVEYCPECTKIIKNEKATQRRRERAEILKQQRLEERNYEPYICLTCGKEFIEDYRKDASDVKKEEPRFCCKECARTYSSHQLDQTRIKLIECTVCHELKEVNIHCSSENFICEECKKPLNKQKENFKKSEKRKNENNPSHTFYKYPQDCILGRFERGHAYKQKSLNLQKLGFNFENPNWEEEFFKVRNLLYDLYYIQKYSLPMIREKFGFIIDKTSKDYLILCGFNKFRGLKEGINLAINNGRNHRGPLSEKPNNFNYQGWYKLKTGKEYFYRSSYELEMIKLLERKNVDFSLNKFHISYKSSKDNKEHDGYPDFYINKYNLIIETKSFKKFDEQNLTDRYKTIKKQGYDFIVITCEGYYFYSKKHFRKEKDSHKKRGEFRLKEFKVLKSFIEDKEKEKQILDLLEIKSSEN